MGLTRKTQQGGDKQGEQSRSECGPESRQAGSAEGSVDGAGPGRDTGGRMGAEVQLEKVKSLQVVKRVHRGGECERLSEFRGGRRRKRAQMWRRESVHRGD